MTTESIPAASSITHEHVFACLNTRLHAHFVREPENPRPLRVLDAGCGDGRMMSYFWKCLQELYPSKQIELYGFDVLDHGVQPKEFMQRAVSRLSEECPGTDWTQRTVGIRVNEPWPFPEAFFDVVVSNQVMEHVSAPRQFLAEHFRVLVQGGSGFHLFPLKHYIHEGHLLLPLVHRIRSWDYMRTYIEALSALGLGKYPEHRRASGVSRKEFAERHADYIYFWTHYLTESQALDIAKSAGFRASYRFTREFYSSKLRSLARARRRARYATDARSWMDAMSVKLLRYASSVTLSLEKQNVY
jgi:SAM-dependent methyltransferase